ncbi:MAG: TolC family protein, partial [bacterium]|nr:TolC family protein [bacterium]
ISTTWGAKDALFGEAAGGLSDASPLPSVNELTDSITRNPDIARWASELAFREANVELERARRIPDVTVELGFKSTGLSDRKVRHYGWDSAGAFEWARSEIGYDSDRDNSLVLGVSVPLPLFDRNQGNIAEAEAMSGKTGELRRQTELAVHAALVDAYEDAAAALAVLDTLHQEAIPKAVDVCEKTQIAYREGKFSYLDVLDAQRTLSEARTAELEALAQFHHAATDMERFTGRSLVPSAEHAARNEPEKAHAE